MQEEYRKWHSPNLSRDFEMLTFGFGGHPLVLFPTSQGRCYENKDFKLIEAVKHFSMSGAFDRRGQLDGFYNGDVYFNNPIDFLPDDQNQELWNLKIVLGIAERDICRHDNESLSKILHQKGINHWLDIRPDTDHDWRVWRAMFPDYLAQL